MEVTANVTDAPAHADGLFAKLGAGQGGGGGFTVTVTSFFALSPQPLAESIDT